MNPVSYQARRATLDDLRPMRELWHENQMPVETLERRLTEFQVLTAPDGTLAGAIGLQMEAHQGRIHSEALGAGLAHEELRSLLWDRVQILARNHGLRRLWTTERGRFWNSAGFQMATDEDLRRLPPGFGAASEIWSCLPLLAEAIPPPNLDREFELFMATQKSDTERTIRQARVFKVAAWCLLVIALAGFALFAWHGLTSVPAVQAR